MLTKAQKRPCDLPSIIYRLIHHVLTLTERLHTQTRRQMMRMSTAAFRVNDWLFSCALNLYVLLFFLYTFLCNLVVKPFLEIELGAHQHQIAV